MWSEQPWPSADLRDLKWQPYGKHSLPHIVFSTCPASIALSSGLIWSRVKDWSWWGVAACGTRINSGQVVLVGFPVHRPGCDSKVAGSKLERFDWWAGCSVLGHAEEPAQVVVRLFWRTVFLLLSRQGMHPHTRCVPDHRSKWFVWWDHIMFCWLLKL